jgi:hypothetical protein
MKNSNKFFYATKAVNSISCRIIANTCFVSGLKWLICSLTPARITTALCVIEPPRIPHEYEVPVQLTAPTLCDQLQITDTLALLSLRDSRDSCETSDTYI